VDDLKAFYFEAVVLSPAGKKLGAKASPAGSGTRLLPEKFSSLSKTAVLKARMGISGWWDYRMDK